MLGLVIGFIFCQLGLAGLFAASPGSLLRTILVAFVTTALMIFSLGMAVGDFSTPTYLIPIVTITALVLALLALRKWNGTALRSIRNVQEHDGRYREAIQFSIRQVMIWTFCVALVLAVSRMLAPIIDVSTFSVVGMYAARFFLVDVVVLWAILGTKNFPSRLGFTIVLVIAIAAIQMISSDVLNSVVMFLSNAFFLAISLVVLRWGGFRLLKTNLASSETENHRSSILGSE